MRMKAKISPLFRVAAIAMAASFAIAPAHAESRWDGLSTTRFDNNFFDFRAGTPSPNPLEERGIETDFGPDPIRAEPEVREFYDRPRTVFETGGKER